MFFGKSKFLCVFFFCFSFGAFSSEEPLKNTSEEVKEGFALVKAPCIRPDFSGLTFQSCSFFREKWSLLPAEVPSSFTALVGFRRKLLGACESDLIMMQSFQRRVAQMINFCKRAGYVPPEGESYIISGCVGLDAIIEYIALSKLFQEYPGSSFKYICIEKNSKAIAFNKSLFSALAIKNTFCICDSILRLGSILKINNIDKRNISLFLCCHPPVLETTAASDSFCVRGVEAGIGGDLINLMSSLASNNTFCCLGVFYQEEAKALVEHSKRKGFSHICIETFLEQQGTPLSDNPLKNLRLFAKCVWNHLRVAFVVK